MQLCVDSPKSQSTSCCFRQAQLVRNLAMSEWSDDHNNLMQTSSNVSILQRLSNGIKWTSSSKLVLKRFPGVSIAPWQSADAMFSGYVIHKHWPNCVWQKENIEKTICCCDCCKRKQTWRAAKAFCCAVIDKSTSPKGWRCLECNRWWLWFGWTCHESFESTLSQCVDGVWNVIAGGSDFQIDSWTDWTINYELLASGQSLDPMKFHL